ncbi:MAG: non-canonical purine NTP pyrophosphatase [Myxococcales bacterium]|nr:non-canonical purine NTP pyrophosphatase [Myxococcales bacterium]MCB9629150.1 non-canonical purine NTP pyrophosphatase [Sandaracinaceae bacterium]
MSHSTPPVANGTLAITLDRLRAAPVVIATHNAGKTGELQALLATLGVRGDGAAALGLPEPAETEDSFTGNALLKARAAAEASGRVAIADDSGVCVDALAGEPGIFTARWAGEPRDWQRAMARVELELAKRGAVLAPARGASFACALAIATPEGDSLTVEGRVPGTLVWPPRGNLGAGFEPMFLAQGQQLTYGEMEPEVRAAINHRAAAFQLLCEALGTAPQGAHVPG